MVQSQWKEPLLLQSNQRRPIINTIHDSTRLCTSCEVSTTAPRALEPLAGKTPEQFQQRSALFFLRSTETETALHTHELITAHTRLLDLQSRVFDDQPLTTRLRRDRVTETNRREPFPLLQHIYKDLKLKAPGKVGGKQKIKASETSIVRTSIAEASIPLCIQCSLLWYNGCRLCLAVRQTVCNNCLYCGFQPCEAPSARRFCQFNAL